MINIFADYRRMVSICPHRLKIWYFDIFLKTSYVLAAVNPENSTKTLRKLLLKWI